MELLFSLKKRELNTILCRLLRGITLPNEANSEQDREDDDEYNESDEVDESNESNESEEDGDESNESDEESVDEYNDDNEEYDGEESVSMIDFLSSFLAEMNRRRQGIYDFDSFSELLRCDYQRNQYYYQLTLAEDEHGYNSDDDEYQACDCSERILADVINSTDLFLIYKTLLPLIPTRPRLFIPIFDGNPENEALLTRFMELMEEHTQGRCEIQSKTEVYNMTTARANLPIYQVPSENT